MLIRDSPPQVTLGENAPVVREGAGAVPSESLAAQSVREGGEFASNRNISEVGSNTASNISSKAPGSAAAGAPGEPQGQAAPGYVSNQYTRDSAGPHGKNITEDPDCKSLGTPNASFLFRVSMFLEGDWLFLSPLPPL